MSLAVKETKKIRNLSCVSAVAVWKYDAKTNQNLKQMHRNAIDIVDCE